MTPLAAVTGARKCVSLLPIRPRVARANLFALGQGGGLDRRTLGPFSVYKGMYLPNGTIRHRRRALATAGLAHELTFSCYKKLPLLSSDPIRGFLVEALELARQRHDFELWAWVAMLDHVHLLISLGPQAVTVGPILGSIKQSVSRRAMRWFRHHNPELLPHLRVRRGARVEYRFWQAGGGYDRDLISTRALRSSIEYLHANPVRGGLVSSPILWRWSSARWYASSTSTLDIEMDPPRLGL